MVEFRWRKGVQQYRTWDVNVCPVDGTLRLTHVYDRCGSGYLVWTGWQDMPTTQARPPLTINVDDAKVQEDLDAKIKAQTWE